MSRPLMKVLLVGALLPAATVGVAPAQEVAANLVRCEGGRCEGTEAADTFVASDRSEEVVAKGGDDDIELDQTIVGGSDDVAFGGPGRDCIDGGAGDDLMVGGPDDDNRPCEFTAFVNPRGAMTGGPGDDVMDGGPGNDTMDGIADDDTMTGGAGNDLIEDAMSLDSDRLFGDDGDDSLNALDGDGTDLIDGGAGKDDCQGDPGDTIRNCETGSASQPGDDNGSATQPAQGSAPEQASDPPSFITVFGSARTTTALRGGLVTIPGIAVRCGLGPCQVDKRVFTARNASASRPAGKRRGLVSRRRDAAAAGETAQVRVRFSGAASRALRRRGRMRVEVLVTVTDAKGRGQTARKAITIKSAR